MAYKERLQANNTEIGDNNTNLQSLIERANSLPDAGEAADPVVQELTIMENGTYEAPDGVDGYNPVVVNVPNEGIAPAGTKQITENGTHDVTDYASAEVNVPDIPAVTEELSVTANGEYTPGDGVDGFSKVTVNVPTSGDSNEIDNLLSGTMTEIENDRISRLAQYAFYYKTAIVKASFPNVTTVSSFAFRYTTSLAEVSLPAWNHTSATSACTYIFANCKALTTVHVPSLTVVPNYTFQACSALAALDLPACSTIGAKAFYNCSGLTALILRSTTMTTLSAVDAFAGTAIESGTGYIYVPSALVDSYKAETNWSTYADQIRAIEDYPDITGG